MKLLNTFLLLICLYGVAYSQQTNSFFPSPNSQQAIDFLSKQQWSCGYVLMDDSSAQAVASQVKAKMVKEPFLKVHGNIYYDYYYRSNIDTPYILKDYQQHTVRTYLDITYKNNYPIRVNFTARVNNAGFLKNMAGVNFQFNSSQFAENIRHKLLDWTTKQQLNLKSLQDLQKQIEEERRKLQAMEPTVNKPSKQQEEIEERERNWLAQINHAPGSSLPADKLIPKNKQDSLLHHVDSAYRIDSLTKYADSIYKRLDSVALARKAKYDSAKQEYDSLYNRLVHLEKQSQSLSATVSSADNNMFNKIKSARSNQQLAGLVSDGNMPDSLLPTGYKSLLAIKSFGIGRTVVDYSELSAKNITISGVQAEFAPHNYYAIAAGIIDYRYRDLVLNNHDQQKQYLSIARFGRGQPDGNNLIFTWYEGKKELYIYVTSRNDSIQVPDYHLMGFTVEGHYKVGNTTLLTAEAAKSASPYYNRTVEGKSMLTSNLSFKDRSNEAYSFKVNSYLPKTGTKLAATYKRIGANFQSFSLFNTSSKQSLWSARVDQPFFSRRLNITASIRTNDFSNPYIDNSYYSNTVFKSVQATLRMKKLPVISVGYFPSSQLTKLDSDHYIENLFYTLTAYLSHFYSWHSTKMSTFLSYTRFYNRQADSGFVYFNTQNLMLNHTMFYSHFSVSASGSAAMNTDYKLYTAGADMQLIINKAFYLKGGLKYNYQTVFNNRQIGYNIGSTIKLLNLGEVQLFAEKGFIPGVNKQLLPNNTGRISYFKIF